MLRWSDRKRVDRSAPLKISGVDWASRLQLIDIETIQYFTFSSRPRTRTRSRMYTTQELLVPPCKLTLPSGVRVSIERPSEETVDGALDVVRSAAVTGDGISSDEVPTRDALLTPSPRMATCVIINMDDASIIAVCIRIHSPLCRSSSPVYCAGPFVTSAQYRGRGLGFEVMQTLGRVHMTQTLYRGFLARATLTAPTRLQYKHQQGYNVGLIPGCTYLSGKGIIDDVVACNEIYTDELKRSWTKEVCMHMI